VPEPADLQPAVLHVVTAGAGRSHTLKLDLELLLLADAPSYHEHLDRALEECRNESERGERADHELHRQPFERD
jgi:hypothetical protein